MNLIGTELESGVLTVTLQDEENRNQQQSKDQSHSANRKDSHIQHESTDSRGASNGWRRNNEGSIRMQHGTKDE